ncbi:MAG: hypothetical protein MZU97_15625 [Bacillus subtilis]|nr:hypothetical protein [Bacillus subtilis]
MVLGVDPAFRTGCKLAVIDSFGKFMAKDVIYPHEAYIGQNDQSKPDRTKPRSKLKTLIAKIQHRNHRHRQRHGLPRDRKPSSPSVIKELNRPVFYVIVSEAGASVYSASDLAREEFPDFARRGTLRRLDRPPDAGSAVRTRQDRSQSDRRRPIPARRLAEQTRRISSTSSFRPPSTKSA